jgi:preprotein translocase subunit SecA
MFQKIAKILGGDPFRKDIQGIYKLVQQANVLETEYESLSNADLLARTDQFRQRIAEAIAGEEDEKERRTLEQDALDEILPEAFAAVREASKRTIGLRHYDVQLIGGVALHHKRIAEMRTGEGKTLVATLPLYLNALTGRGVHLVTVNDYLARRDARWMAPIYFALGLKVGVLQMAARTENGKMAFLVNLDKKSPKEDQHQLELVPRKEAYQADIVYGTNSEFGFDYLRDNLTNALDERVQRGHYYAIVDEVDNILIDEARTPLIISGPASEDVAWYAQMAAVVRQLRPEDYEVNEKDHAVSLTELGEVHVEELLGVPMRDPERPEDVTPEQARMLGYLEQSLRAQFLFHRNKDYLVQGGKVVIVDEFTGRLMPGRRWSDGLHQAVEAKEGVKVEPENVTYATITIQNYFRMYEKLAGMTGTALTEAEEFYKIYKLDVLPIPTNLDYMAEYGTDFQSFETKDDQGYKFVAYARRDDTAKSPIFYKRKDYPDVVYRTEEAKLRAVTLEIIRFHVIGRPQLVGTTSVEHSERLSGRLDAEPIRRLLQVQLIRHVYMKKNKIEASERAIDELKPLNKPLPDLEIGDLRNLTRTLKLDLSLSLEEPENLDRLVEILELEAEDKPRLVKALQGGIAHQVLNARKHDEESMIIARAGAFGAVTIATNMAGRGVDIKLGDELPEDLLADVVRVLHSNGYSDPYEMSNEQRKQELLKLSPEQIGIYEEQVKAFLQYLDEMVMVRQLGGLHVIGTERHEARRIDNQLRGRAARQGDPGSSRFYLSLEDELMRLFGGAQAEGLFKRLNIDEGLPIESGIIGGLVAQSQERVEGSNFDVRKHLLEYDDVLNDQRKRIYGQRDRVFDKEDLSEDVIDMLRSELQVRIPKSLKDDEGPWKLLAYLDQVQPPIDFEDIFYPSYNLRLLLDELRRKMPAHGEVRYRVRDGLLLLAEAALLAEKDHVLRNTHTMLENTQESLGTQRQERFETLDNYFEGLQNPVEPEEGQPAPQPRRPLEILEELQSLVRAQLRLNPDQMSRLADGDEDVKDAIRSQIEGGLMALTANRLLGAVERRLEESIGLKVANLAGLEYEVMADQILQAVEVTFNGRVEHLLGDQGQIAHDLDPILDRLGEAVMEERNLLALMQIMAIGNKLSFDRKTHRQGWRRYNRLSYPYLAARLVEGRSPEAITDDVIEHLEGAREALVRVWGRAEWLRLSQQGELNFQNFDERLQNLLVVGLGEERFEELEDQPLNSFAPADIELVSAVLGKRLQNEIYRQLLLGVISEQWVDYLTKVEGLRVSIGMEAYAQRNPLVEYKGQASRLFGELLSDIRQGVISRMFTTQPRRSSEASVQAAPAPVPANATASQPAPELPAAAPAASSGAPAPRQAPAPTARPERAPVGAPPSAPRTMIGSDGKKKRKRH